MDYRVLTEAERKYTFSQSQQLSMQTGLIGYLRADFGSNGNEFWTTWNDFRKDLKTDEFKAEFDDVINGLRDGDVLSGRNDMSSYCYSTPDSSFNDDRNHYGIRLDTEKYSYLMRFNPNRGEYNLYCYCYQKEWLNSHLKNAERGIRFIDPHYQEQFRIADGEKISIKLGDGKTMERTCRYIDDYHVEVGDNLYHICEFAERMEQNGHTYEPVRTELPEQCYSILPGSGEIIVVKRNEKGYYNPHIPASSQEQAREIVDEYNGKLGVTRAQEEAMRTGSMFGFHVPGADPKNYDKDGKPLPAKDRGDAR